MQVENVYLIPAHVHKPAIGIHFLHLNVAEEFYTAVELHVLQPYYLNNSILTINQGRVEPT